MSVTAVYQKAGEGLLNKPEGTAGKGPQAGAKSFAEVLFTEPAKNAVEAAKSAESAAIASTNGEMDELTVAELINEADVALQEFKAIWEKSLQALNELPRVSM